MFLSIIVLGLLLIFFYLWGDYIKILIYLEVVRLVFISSDFIWNKIRFFFYKFFF